MLTLKQRQYAESRANGFSMKESAIAAGCPEGTAPQVATKLEKHPNVVEHIARLSMATNGTESKAPAFDDPLAFMLKLMNDPVQDPKLRLEAAKALASFTLSKPGDKSKKAEKKEAASKIQSSGRFAASKPPTLRVGG